MFDKHLRPYFQVSLVDPVARLLVRMGLRSPLFFTLLGCLTGLAGAMAIWLDTPWLAVGLLIISGYFDFLDGTLARLLGKSSSLGSVLDFFSDRIVDFAIILALFGVAPTERGFLSLLMLGGVFLCVTSFLLVSIFTENHSSKGMHFSPGIIERGEAFVFFVLMILAPARFIVLAWAFTLLVLLTAGLRICQYCCNFSLCSIRSKDQEIQ